MDVKSLSEALNKQFPQPTKTSDGLGSIELLERLYALHSKGVEEPTVMQALGSDIQDQHNYAIIAFLDEQLTQRIEAADLPPSINSKLKGVSANVMRIAIADGLLAMTKSPVLPITEAVLALTYGWSDLKGKALESTEQKLNDALQSLALATRDLDGTTGTTDARNNLLDLLEGDVVRFVSNERDRIKKVEQRLADANIGKLTAERSKVLASKMLNNRMEGEALPKGLVEFLQGVWFDSAQLIATRQGVENDAWYKVVKLTDTLISTVQPNGTRKTDPVMTALTESEELSNAEEIPALNKQPQDTNNQHLYRILEDLPNEIKGCLVSIEHDAAAIAEALALIESVHIDILKGQSFEAHPFQLIPIDDAINENTRVSQSLLMPVTKITAGDWFVFTDDSGSSRHIKLTLKSDESRHLIFTNRNGSSVLETGFEEFAYLMASSTVHPLPQPGELLKNVRRNLMASLKSKAKEDQAEEGRKKRQEQEALIEVMNNTQYILVAIPKDQLEDPSAEAITLDRKAALKAQEIDESGNSLIYLDQTGHSLPRPEVAEIVRLVTGETIDIEDEMPVGMTDFKAAVAQLRDHTKRLAAAKND